MTVRQQILKRIEKKRVEISVFEAKMREATIYIQASEDIVKLLPEDDEDTFNPNGEVAPITALKELREGTMIARVKEALQKAGKPLHISELLNALGRENDKDERAAVSGSIAAYVRKKEIFNRPAPNTFGLLEFLPAAKFPPIPDPEPPHEFGQDITDDDVPF